MHRLQRVSGGNGDIARRLIQAYDEFATASVAGLQAALASADLDAVHHLGHSLKGASAEVGAEDVAAIAARLEFAALAACAADVEAVTAAVPAAIAALRRIA
jgi:HPt (histidine-containing phosphotransfer) domain-containing protein